jgi:hypothetical protein
MSRFDGPLTFQELKYPTKKGDMIVKDWKFEQLSDSGGAYVYSSSYIPSWVGIKNFEELLLKLFLPEVLKS